jgi:hypothetical protein
VEKIDSRAPGFPAHAGQDAAVETGFSASASTALPQCGTSAIGLNVNKRLGRVSVNPGKPEAVYSLPLIEFGTLQRKSAIIPGQGSRGTPDNRTFNGSVFIE